MSDPELIIQYLTPVAECTQILTAMFQHLAFPQEAVTAAKDKLLINTYNFQRNNRYTGVCKLLETYCSFLTYINIRLRTQRNGRVMHYALAKIK